MAFGKKKKKEETAEELRARLAELEDKPEEDLDVLPEAPNPPKKVKAVQAKPKQIGEFSLNSDEMALAVNALASSEEFKLYQQMVLGQQIAEIIAAYNKAVGGKSEVLSEEDTDEEEDLPQPR